MFQSLSASQKPDTNDQRLLFHRIQRYKGTYYINVMYCIYTYLIKILLWMVYLYMSIPNFIFSFDEQWGAGFFGSSFVWTPSSMVIKFLSGFYRLSKMLCLAPWFPNCGWRSPYILLYLWIFILLFLSIFLQLIMEYRTCTF